MGFMWCISLRLSVCMWISSSMNIAVRIAEIWTLRRLLANQNLNSRHCPRYGICHLPFLIAKQSAYTHKESASNCSFSTKLSHLSCFKREDGWYSLKKKTVSLFFSLRNRFYCYSTYVRKCNTRQTLYWAPNIHKASITYFVHVNIRL